MQPFELQSEHLTSPDVPAPRGLLFPSVPGLVARQTDGYVVMDAGGFRAEVRGPLCLEIERSLQQRAATEVLRRLRDAHPALALLASWLETPAVPLTHEGVVRLDGFDTLFVELLGQCNERCVHCYADSAPTVTDALSRETVLSVVDQAAAMGFRRIQFTGGDPLLCDFLDDAVARARSAGISGIEIYTNGLALTDELLARLAPHAPSFAFSVYSTRADEHDRITRTPGSHRRTLAAIDRVVSRGLACRAAAVVMEPGVDVDALVTELRARGVGFVSWSRAFAVGRGADVAQQSADVVAAQAATTQESGGHREPTPHADIKEDETAPPKPRVASGKLCVTYTGDVVPCIFQRRSRLGSVREGRTLLDIVRDPEIETRRGLPTLDDAKQRLQCSSCRLTDITLAWLKEKPSRQS